MEQLIEMVLQALRAAGIHCVRALDEETLPRLKAPMVAVGADPSACRQHALARYLGQDADGAERYGMEQQATLQLEVYSPGRRAGALCERAAGERLTEPVAHQLIECGRMTLEQLSEQFDATPGEIAKVLEGYGLKI